MRKLILVFLSMAAFPSSSSAQQSALSQLGIEPGGVPVPMAPPDRGDAAAAVYNHWDPAAPFSYWQMPARVLPSEAGLVRIENVRSGPVPADHKAFAWSTVKIDPSRIEKAVYAYRTAGTGHTFLVFTFREGGASGADGEIKALTFGAEGWSREPGGYTLYHALAGRYPLIWLATTFDNYAQLLARDKKRETYFRNISIGRAETLRLFELLLARIEETNRNRETYNLFSNSCTNNPVNLLNQVVPESQRISLEVAGLMNPNASIPKYAVKKYTEKGTLQAAETGIGPGNFDSFDITKI